FFDEERAGNLEQEVAPEKHAGAEPNHRVVETRQLLRHRELRDRDVGAVDVRDDVAGEEQREKAPVGFGARAIQGGGGSGGSEAHHEDGLVIAYWLSLIGPFRKQGAR